MFPQSEPVEFIAVFSLRDVREENHNSFIGNYSTNMRSNINGEVVKRFIPCNHWKFAADSENEIRTALVPVSYGEGDKVSKTWLGVCYSLIPDSWRKKPLAEGSRFLSSLVRDQGVTHTQPCFTHLLHNGYQG